LQHSNSQNGKRKPLRQGGFASPKKSVKQCFRQTFSGGAKSSRRVKLLKFGLKLLIDEQQSLNCANHVAATGGYNIIDNGVGTIWVAADRGAGHGHILRFKGVPFYSLSRPDVWLCTLFTGQTKHITEDRPARREKIGCGDQSVSREQLGGGLSFANSLASNVSNIECRTSSRDGSISLAAISLR
jgi:hypothetical protein